MACLPVVRLVLSALAVGLGLGTVLPGALAASLTLYSAQHEQTVDLLTKAFTKETGIDVKVRNGEGPELASELVKEGASSPADVFFTENSPELELLSEKGLLAKAAPATLASVPTADSGPNGDWVGVLAREIVLAYNTTTLEWSRRRTCRRPSSISPSRNGRAKSRSPQPMRISFRSSAQSWRSRVAPPHWNG